MTAKVRFYPAPLLRTLVAIACAFLLTRWSSLAVLALPWQPEQSVVAGMLLGFSVFAATVIWVFVAGSLRIACLGILPAGAFLMYFSQQGAL